MENPKENLRWLDLSSNPLTTLPDNLADYPNIQVLYLHGTLIKSPKEVNKLLKLPNLTTLTLHATPFEQRKDYKNFVISKLPNLKKLDFSMLTKGDRANALQYKSRARPKKSAD